MIGTNTDLYGQQYQKPGRVQEHDPAEKAVTLLAEEDIYFGRFLSHGSESEQVVTATSSKLAGISGASVDASNMDNNTYLKGDPVVVFKRGVVIVPITEDATVKDDVRVFISGDNRGKCCKTAIAGETALLEGCEFFGESKNGVIPISLSGYLRMTPDKAKGVK